VKRLVPTLALVGFLAFQAYGVARGFADPGFGFPWAMFRSMDDTQYYLEAWAITDEREIQIPLDRAFPYHAAQTDFSAFDWPPLSRNLAFQERASHWLGHWSRKRGVPATHVRLRWRILDLRTGEISYSPILEVDLRAPPVR
jgi:hypothetical protein